MRCAFFLAAMGMLVGCSDEASTDGRDDEFLRDGKLDTGNVEEGSRKAIGVLAVANELAQAELDDAVGLAARAAAGIVKHRDGADGVLGTTDDDPFDTLAELDAVGYVGSIAFGKLLDYAVANGYVAATTYQDVDAGNEYGCGLAADGTIACWGVIVPIENITPPAGSFSQLSTGSWHACALSTSGMATCWGLNTDGQSDAPPGIFTQVSAGHAHSCGLRPNGTVECWGASSVVTENPAIPSGPFMQVSAGTYYSCGLKTDGTLACWGQEAFSWWQTPTGQFSAVDAGRERACAVKRDGSLLCWGKITATDTKPPAGSFAQVDAGEWHACAVSDTGTIACWEGSNAHGEMTAPAGAFVKVAVGPGFTCGLEAGGMATCWGDGSSGATAIPQ